MELSYEGVCFDLFGTLVTGEGEPIAGVLPALALLPPARWAIVTSCGLWLARGLIASAKLPPPAALVSSNDVVLGKPAPDPYVLAAQRLGRDPARIVVIEDSLEGIAAGRAAGMDVVAIARGRGAAFARNATAHVERFEQLGWSVNDDGSIGLRL
jgi:sugar-phosphatase